MWKRYVHPIRSENFWRSTNRERVILPSSQAKLRKNTLFIDQSAFSNFALFVINIIIHYYTVSLTRDLQRNESTSLSRIFYDKNLFRNPKSTFTAHTRPTPEYLARNHFFWPRFSHSMRASLVLLKLPRSCPKRILGNSAIP